MSEQPLTRRKHAPFSIPGTLDEVLAALHKPLDTDQQLSNLPQFPNGAHSAHPFNGGSKAGYERIKHLIESGSMSSYKDTRNGLLGLDFSTKLSAWLSLGTITSRQVHWRLVEFEDGKTDVGKGAQGYGKGENKVRMRSCLELVRRKDVELIQGPFGVGHSCCTL